MEEKLPPKTVEEAARHLPQLQEAMRNARVFKVSSAALKQAEDANRAVLVQQLLAAVALRDPPTVAKARAECILWGVDERDPAIRAGDNLALAVEACADLRVCRAARDLGALLEELEEDKALLAEMARGRARCLRAGLPCALARCFPCCFPRCLPAAAVQLCPPPNSRCAFTCSALHALPACLPQCFVPILCLHPGVRIMPLDP